MVFELKLITALVLDKNSDLRIASSCERSFITRNLTLVVLVRRSNEMLAMPAMSRNELLAETYRTLMTLRYTVSASLLMLTFSSRDCLSVLMTSLLG